MKKLTKTKKSTKLGRYRLGPMWVNLIVNPKTDGGWFDIDAEELGVGLKAVDWGACLTCLIHEAMEMAFMQVRGRFCPAPDYANASDGYLFVAGHADFSEICARVGNFLTWAVPELAKVWISGKKESITWVNYERV